MSYSIIANDIINVDQLIEQIKLYAQKFRNYEESFIHCKNVEEFERKLELQVPDSSYKIARIYGSGRDLAIAIQSNIHRWLAIEQTSLLKTAVDNLEYQITGLKDRTKDEYLEINKTYEESGYRDWSINEMLSITLEMFQQIDEIIITIRIIKSSYSYKAQSGELSLTEIRDLMGAKMNTINNSGNFQNTQISNGENNSGNMTMTNNQGISDRLTAVCQKLIEVIENSSAEQTEKDTVKAIVHEIEAAKTPLKLKDAYNDLISSMSSHITIGTAILTSSALPLLSDIILK